MYPQPPSIHPLSFLQDVCPHLRFTPNPSPSPHPPHPPTLNPPTPPPHTHMLQEAELEAVQAELEDLEAVFFAADSRQLSQGKMAVVRRQHRRSSAR